MSYYCITCNTSHHDDEPCPREIPPDPPARQATTTPCQSCAELRRQLEALQTRLDTIKTQKAAAQARYRARRQTPF